MPDLSQLHFIRPQMFYLVIPALFFSWCLWRYTNQAGWSKLIADNLLQHLAINPGKKQLRHAAVFSFLLWSIAITALAGPAFEKQKMPVSRNDHALVIVLDLSLSMLAQDQKPSRLVRARQKILDILKLRKEGTTALVTYSGDAHRVVPLSEDEQNIASLLSALNPQMMPVMGSNPVQAIEQAIGLLHDAQLQSGDILLVADDMEPAQVDEIDALLKNTAFKLSIIAMGTEQGAPVPMPDGTHLKDPYGNTVFVPANFKTLQALAAATSAKYHQLSLDNSDISHLLEPVLIDLQDSIKENNNRELEQWIDSGIYLLVLLLPFSLYLFRRGVLLSVMLLIVAFPLATHSPVAHASGEEQANKQPAANINTLWNKLWYNSEQRGQMALQAGQAEIASKTFNNPDWQASALYRMGDYQKAADLFASRQTNNSSYNHATSLAKAGKLENALEEYKKVLNENPGHEDAKYNKKLIEDLLERQKQEQQQNKQQQQQQQQNQNQNQNQQQDQSSDKQQSGDQQQDQNQQNQNENQDQKNDQQNQQQNQSAGQQQDSANPENNQQQESQNPADNTPQSPAEQSDHDKPEKSAANNQQTETEATDRTGNIQEQAKSDNEQETEQQRKTRIWLEQIPDDPSGLLRRKFQYESRVKEGNRHMRQEGKLW